MYEIVNEPNLIIAFDMDTELSQFGVFGVYIKQGYNICAGYIDPSDWSGIHTGYKELVALYANCKGTATFTYVLTEEGDTLTFSLQPRERDYAYAGSFYAFAIWVGMGVAGTMAISYWK